MKPEKKFLNLLFLIGIGNSTIVQSIREAFGTIIGYLAAEDTISVISFGINPRIIMPSTMLANKEELILQKLNVQSDNDIKVRNPTC
ncbi:MAG: hypothetical protein RDU59_12705 [Thermodesulfobacteriota bacterium]|nr:hypothetical protein [Thermodesulfobacteriota bacterium]